MSGGSCASEAACTKGWEVKIVWSATLYYKWPTCAHITRATRSPWAIINATTRCQRADSTWWRCRVFWWVHGSSVRCWVMRCRGTGWGIWCIVRAWSCRIVITRRTSGSGWICKWLEIITYLLVNFLFIQQKPHNTTYTAHASIHNWLTHSNITQPLYAIC